MVGQAEGAGLSGHALGEFLVQMNAREATTRPTPVLVPVQEDWRLDRSTMCLS